MLTEGLLACENFDFLKAHQSGCTIATQLALLLWRRVATHLW